MSLLPEEARERLAELERNLEEINQEWAEAEKRLIVRKARKDIVYAIAFKQVTDNSKMSAVKAQQEVYFIDVDWRDELSTYAQEVEICADLEAIVIAKKRKAHAASERIDALRSILSRDKELVNKGIL